MVLADGQRQEMTRELFVQFQPGILTEPEIGVATEGLNHTGLPIDKNTNQHFSPRSRISGFDTVEAQEAQGWTDEERELVEQKLLTSPYIGLDFIRLDEAQATFGAPWATYDTTPGEKVVGLARDLGISMADVLAYERANRNDAGLVYLLERELATPAEEANDAAVVIEA
jgi:hypothetical protein